MIHPGNLAGKGPLGMKAPKPEAKGLTRARAIKAKPRKARVGDDPAYLAAVRLLPCCICAAWGWQQTTPTEAHHAICGRYGQHKTPDCMAIPLCRDHHTGPQGIHTMRALWVATFGPDTDHIPATQDAVAGQLNSPRG